MSVIDVRHSDAMESVSQEEKRRALASFPQHLESAETERVLYRKCTDEAKLSCLKQNT